MYHFLINLTKLGELVQLSLCCKLPTKIIDKCKNTGLCFQQGYQLRLCIDTFLFDLKRIIGRNFECENCVSPILMRTQNQSKSMHGDYLGCSWKLQLLLDTKVFCNLTNFIWTNFLPTCSLNFPADRFLYCHL